MKTTIGTIIKKYRKTKNITQKQLSQLTGFNQNTISNHENGNRSLNEHDINIYAQALNIELYEFFTYSPDDKTICDIHSVLKTLNQEQKNEVLNFIHQQQITSFPKPSSYVVDLYGYVSAGSGETLFDNPIEQIISHQPVPKHDLALQVNGDSMLPLFNDKDILFVEKQTQLQSGQIGVFIINNEAYVKKLKIENNAIRLISLNKKYKDLIFTENDNIVTVGKVLL